MDACHAYIIATVIVFSPSSSNDMHHCLPAIYYTYLAGTEVGGATVKGSFGMLINIGGIIIRGITDLSHNFTMATHAL